MLTSAMQECLAAYAEARTPDASIERKAVQEVLKALTAAAPGKSVELRIPPYAAVQVVAGPSHRRGTPAATVEMRAAALLKLAAGDMSWVEAVRNGTVIASGERSDLAGLFPC